MCLHSSGGWCAGRVEGGEGDDTVSCPLLSSLLDVSAVKWFTVVKQFYEQKFSAIFTTVNKTCLC